MTLEYADHAATVFYLPNPDHVGEGEYRHVLEWVGIMLDNAEADGRELTRAEAREAVAELGEACKAVIRQLYDKPDRKKRQTL